MALLTTFTRMRVSCALSRSGTVRFILCCLLLLGGWDLAAQTAPSKEYKIKAVLLFNFAQFVDWPPQTFPEQTKPLEIGVLGEDPFGAYLDEVVRGERVKNRPVVVHRYRRVEEIKTCHVLFISRSEPNRWEQIFAGLKGRNILTVGDADDFARSGGMIQFATDKGKIRLNINVESAKASDLTISSKLLRSAEIITTGKD